MVDLLERRDDAGVDLSPNLVEKIEQGLCPLSYVANSRRARGASFDFLLPYPFLFGLFRKHQARLPRASKPSRPGRKHLRFAPGGP